jgi:hypothetical protein
MSVKKVGKELAVFVLLFFFGFTAASFGQEKTNRETVEVYQSLSPTEIAKYSNYDFKDNFAMLLESDKTRNYFFLDLSKMSTSFELKYFLYLAYQSGNGVQISHGLSQDRAWFIVDKKSSEREALKQILKLKQSALDKEKSLTESEKKDWIKSKNY